MTKQEIREKLDNSLEVSTIRLWIKIEIGMVLLVCGLHFLSTLLNRYSYPDESFWMIYGFVAVIVLIPCLQYTPGNCGASTGNTKLAGFTKPS